MRRTRASIIAQDSTSKGSSNAAEHLAEDGWPRVRERRSGLSTEEDTMEEVAAKIAETVSVGT